MDDLSSGAELVDPGEPFEEPMPSTEAVEPYPRLDDDIEEQQEFSPFGTPSPLAGSEEEYPVTDALWERGSELGTPFGAEASSKPSLGGYPQTDQRLSSESLTKLPESRETSADSHDVPLSIATRKKDPLSRPFEKHSPRATRVKDFPVFDASKPRKAKLGSPFDPKGKAKSRENSFPPPQERARPEDSIKKLPEASAPVKPVEDFPAFDGDTSEEAELVPPFLPKKEVSAAEPRKFPYRQKRFSEESEKSDELRTRSTAAPNKSPTRPERPPTKPGRSVPQSKTSLTKQKKSSLESKSTAVDSAPRNSPVEQDRLALKPKTLTAESQISLDRPKTPTAGPEESHRTPKKSAAESKKSPMPSEEPATKPGKSESRKFPDRPKTSTGMPDESYGLPKKSAADPKKSPLRSEKPAAKPEKSELQKSPDTPKTSTEGPDEFHGSPKMSAADTKESPMRSGKPAPKPGKSESRKSPDGPKTSPEVSDKSHRSPKKAAADPKESPTRKPPTKPGKSAPHPKTPRAELKIPASPKEKPKKTPDRRKVSVVEPEKLTAKPKTKRGGMDAEEEGPHTKSQAPVKTARTSTSKTSGERVETVPSSIPILPGSTEGNCVFIPETSQARRYWLKNQRVTFFGILFHFSLYIVLSSDKPSFALPSNDFSLQHSVRRSTSDHLFSQ